jgi:hypothetical protein
LTDVLVKGGTTYQSEARVSEGTRVDVTEGTSRKARVVSLSSIACHAPLPFSS